MRGALLLSEFLRRRRSESAYPHNNRMNRLKTTSKMKKTENAPTHGRSKWEIVLNVLYYAMCIGAMLFVVWYILFAWEPTTYPLRFN